MKRSTLAKSAAVAGACAVVGAGAGIVGSAAAPVTKSKSKSGTSQPGPLYRGLRHGGRAFGFHGPAVHSQEVVLNKAGNGWITATDDNGTVKSVSGNDVVLSEGTQSVHYKDVTVTIPGGATVYRNGAKASVGDLKQGDEIHVTSSSDGTTVFAEDPAHQMSGPGGPHGPDGGPGGPPPGGAGPYGGY